jgi:1,6-anhydro-N-acetylmuramate kinase
MRVVASMSRTSMDGLDAAVAEIEWDGGAVAMSPLRHIERPWPDEVRARLHAPRLSVQLAIALMVGAAHPGEDFFGKMDDRLIAEMGCFDGVPKRRLPCRGCGDVTSGP